VRKFSYLLQNNCADSHATVEIKVKS